MTKHFLIIILTVVLSTSGFAKTVRPEIVFDKFIHAMRTGDFATAETYIYTQDGESLFDSEEFNSESQFLIKLFNKTTYEASSAIISSEAASMPVLFKTPDISGAVMAIIQELMAIALSAVNEGDEDSRSGFSDGEMEEILIEKLLAALDDPSIEILELAVEVKFHLIGDKWLIDFDESLMNALFGNLLTGLSPMMHDSSDAIDEDTVEMNAESEEWSSDEDWSTFDN